MSSEYSLNARLRALSWAINLTRLNIILLLVTSVLLWVGQGQDLLTSMIEGGAFESRETVLNRISLFGSTALWALSIWLWARVLLSIKFPDSPEIDEKLMLPYRKHLPRALAVIAFAAVAINLARAATETIDYFYAFAMAVEGLVIWWLLIKRRDYARRFIAKGDKNHWAWVEELENPDHPPLFDSLRAALHGIQGRIAAFTAALGVVLLAWGLAHPLSMGNTLDTLLLLMLWGATMLPWGSMLTYWGNRRGYPVLLFSIIGILVFSLWNDNHPIRTLETAGNVEERPTLEAAIDAWKEHNCRNGECPRFVFVATAGGGIRAAYWTGTVLGEVHDLAGGAPFAERLFGVSGVSGGSVGATVYRAIAQTGQTPLTKQVQEALGQDYLGPVSAGLLYRDLPQAMLPVVLLSDRAEVFEQGLEEGFSAAMKDQASLAASFAESALFQGREWPALFLNSTWSDNGRRIVGATLQPPQGALYQDLLNTLGKDMRLSTAAHNSARFPLVSPAGYWNPVESEVEKQRLQDGGLFENYGAETALEILKVAEQRLGDDFHPLVIMITSDPRLRADISQAPFNKPLGFVPELLSTFHTYARVRLGRGAEAAGRLKAWSETYGSDVFQYFRMCGEGADGKEPPLGWALSSSAQRDIRGYLESETPDDCRKGNQQALQNVVGALR